MDRLVTATRLDEDSPAFNERMRGVFGSQEIADHLFEVGESFMSEAESLLRNPREWRGSVIPMDPTIHRLEGKYDGHRIFLHRLVPSEGMQRQANSESPIYSHPHRHLWPMVVYLLDVKGTYRMPRYDHMEDLENRTIIEERIFSAGDTYALTSPSVGHAPLLGGESWSLMVVGENYASVSHEKNPSEWMTTHDKNVILRRFQKLLAERK